jgi:outer membrane receptor protein involved in Fe transport
MFQHVSFETFLGTIHELPQIVDGSPPPQPFGTTFYGPLSSPEPERSFFINIDGKYSLGPVTLTFNVPWGKIHPQLSFGNVLAAPPHRFDYYDRWVILEYKDRFWKQRFGVSARGYFTQLVNDVSPHILPASGAFPPFMEPDGTTNPGGLAFRNFGGGFMQRTGATLDLDLNLPRGVRILGGAELFWESMSNNIQDFPTPQSPASLPAYCPVRDQGGGRFALIDNCPRQFYDDASRLVVAGYLNLQYRPVRQLTLDAGARLQQAFGNPHHDLVPLWSGALVWSFLPGFHFKATYARGFRSPYFYATQAALGSLNTTGRGLQTELSQAFQGELNARLLRDRRQIRELELRVDYSYTFLDRLIQLQQSGYSNNGQRAIHSVELYGRLYLHGDHVLWASYTFLWMQAADLGVIRALPGQWASLGLSINVVPKMFDLNANLLVTSAYRDPNRVPNGPGSLPPCPPGSMGCFDPTSQATPTDLTFDRLTPVALLQLGFRLRFFKERFGVNGQFYNVLDQRYWLPDFSYDLTPSFDFTPLPAPGFSFFASLNYRQ